MLTHKKSLRERNLGNRKPLLQFGFEGVKRGETGRGNAIQAFVVSEFRGLKGCSRYTVNTKKWPKWPKKWPRGGG